MDHSPTGRRYAADSIAGLVHDGTADAPTCMLSSIPRDRLVTFGSLAVAYNLGFRPCGTCIPPISAEDPRPKEATAPKRDWFRRAI